ncbi:hypothetical protein NEFER03_0610 [Nematocida sp. LUAm3]|nr:hypothetical protein NEFER03_0610 [Nematocida sp. LUAm3]KAI5178393.1 hypothetical protein NEFER01_1540 [Nematocida sp. LUAm1]
MTGKNILILAQALVIYFIFAGAQQYHYYGMTANNQTSSIIKGVEGYGELVEALKRLPGNRAIVVFTKDMCPPCKEYKPILERLVQGNSKYREAIFMCHLTPAMLKDSNCLPNLFKIRALPSTVPVWLNGDGSTIGVGAITPGVIPHIHQYAMEFLKY